jgi:hypothetical protein
MKKKDSPTEEDNIILQALKSGNSSKASRLWSASLPPHLKNSLFTDMMVGFRLMEISTKRYKKEMEELTDYGQAIAFFEFFRIEDSIIPMNPDYDDSWIKNGIYADHPFLDRCKVFFETHKTFINFNVEYVIKETLFSMYSNPSMYKELSKKHFLNMLLLSKVALINEHFNLIIDFYKEYKRFSSVSLALKHLINTYEKSIRSKHEQIALLTTPIIRHKFGITKATADNYASALINVFREKLLILEADDSIISGNSQIYIDDLDAFVKVRQVKPVDVKNLVPLKYSEDYIQTRLQQIIGENFHKKDWGGELNDLYSTHFMHGGTRKTVAFLLKGYGTKGKLTIAKCGKNGDQIVRLTMIEADIYFIQHVGLITEEVRQDISQKVELMRRKGKSVQFCLVDGTDTARILMAYNLL